MIELVALAISIVVVIFTVTTAIKNRRQTNQIWDRVAVNDIHIQNIQSKVGVEKEPEVSRKKVKPLMKRTKPQ